MLYINIKEYKYVYCYFKYLVLFVLEECLHDTRTVAVNDSMLYVVN